MGVKVVEYKEPDGVRVAYTNPGEHHSPPIKTGKIKYHYSNKGREFDFERHFVPGRVLVERVIDDNLKWRRFGDMAELRVNLGKEDFLEVSWFKGALHKGVIHRDGKKDIKFNSMFGEYALEYDNPENGHTYNDPEYSFLKSNIGKGEATKEIYQLFVAPYAKRLAEYARVLDTQKPIKWTRRGGEAWKTPSVAPDAKKPSMAMRLRKLLQRG